MIRLSLADVAELAGGVLSPLAEPSAIVRGPVVADSRRVERGSLFVALPGERVDGHDYAGRAVADGAVAVLASRDVGVPAIVVDDTTLALGRLARGYLRLLDATVVGVTGSSGKTSTKDLLAAVLSTNAPTVAPEGSFNTEVGLPLTVLRADADTRFLALEMSARGVGHIAYLCQLAPPRVGVVLNVGSAHLGEFGSREVIAKAKGELVEALPPDGVAVLNADDDLVAAMRDRTDARVVSFGRGPDADVRAADVRVDALARPSFRLETPAGSAELTLAVHGEHQVSNALAVTAVALELGMSIDAVVAALTTAKPASRWRMEVHERADGVTVVNDAYNANPESMRAALAALAAMGGTRRTWAVLGLMAELGAASPAEHMNVGSAVAAAGIDRLIVVGKAAEAIAQGAVAGGFSPSGVRKAADVDEAVALLEAELWPGEVVLV
jgi:UDP-N-acetylmuramoyl-tripeptide--D-alanyl-D-alanine ligase